MNKRIRRKKSFLSNIIDKIKDGLNEVEDNKIKGIDSADDKRREMLIWCACIVGSILLAFLTIKFVFEKK